MGVPHPGALHPRAPTGINGAFVLSRVSESRPGAPMFEVEQTSGDLGHPSVFESEQTSAKTWAILSGRVFRALS